ncbi:hypothetical protein JCGZ_20190 [Jatropha curcas]|uniref:Uncharacterized protein n=1 Tax=Jatropha curcas TaxID=180498 RepID=A0A067JTS5_JATCU|nr:uncharacterized protein LOC105643972 [Jatropha curcas]KDP27366.1 hypothetical protein JCGZ_20190 [Jatropha curcas]
MSLALIQGYSSAEEEEPPAEGYQFSSDDEDGDGYDNSSANGGRRSFSYKPVFDQSAPSNGSSGLPSALDAFSEISGPPQFLNNCVEEQASVRDVEQQLGRHGRRRNRKEKKDLPTGVVVEAKAQLVGIHERVRSDMEANQPPTSSVPSTTQEGAKRAPTATNPNAEDAAELLRMCLQCGIPKTYSSARGMVCPVCGDRPPSDTSKEQKKKGSTVKDKEKSKRMKGQSSHATWKSETEMQLRQQFD